MKNNEKKDDTIKIILLGASGVGKTNLINVFLGLEFNEYTESNSASSFEQSINYKNKTYIYYIWDTAGQEKYRAVNKIFVRGAKIVLIVYAIDNRNSFNEVDYWINMVKESLPDGKYIMALVANKIDLYEKQVVIDEEGENAAKKYGIEFITTSALTGADLFKNFINRLIINYIESTEEKGEGNKKKKKDNFKINNNNNNGDNNNNNQSLNKKACC